MLDEAQVAKMVVDMEQRLLTRIDQAVRQGFATFQLTSPRGTLDITGTGPNTSIDVKTPPAPPPEPVMDVIVCVDGTEYNAQVKGILGEPV